VPHIQDEVNLFEKAYPNIHVNAQNVAQGAPEYTKLRNALKAGSGALTLGTPTSPGGRSPGGVVR